MWHIVTEADEIQIRGDCIVTNSLNSFYYFMLEICTPYNLAMLHCNFKI